MSDIVVTVSSTQSVILSIAKAAELLMSHQEVIIAATNHEISRAIQIVELLKHRIKGLHQENKFERVKDKNKTRVVIKLSFNEPSTISKGYQKPIPIAEVQEITLEKMKKLLWIGVERNEEGRGERIRSFRGSRRGWRGAPRFEETKNETPKDEEDKEKETRPEDSVRRRVCRSRRGIRGDRRRPCLGRCRQYQGGFVSTRAYSNDSQNSYEERKSRRGDRMSPRSVP
ncbi:hypothetical protein SteCoe_21267 [Stentor coeruleus]|uniref:DNA/RNA-binding protein Alba-like domain-containing protein n=1 Tax=Stentor coeruleus TaxID=5963 RepID=A0A1R2BQ28_9CILI|nr:hypothetical protein SteCoe_21267 [Stentor coeruleus]